VKVAAAALAAIAMLVPAAAGAPRAGGCPFDRSLGTVVFVRGGAWHAVSLADCRERAAGAPKPSSQGSALRSAQGRIATVVAVHAKGTRFGSHTIVVDGRPVHRVVEDYRGAPAGSPGPLGLIAWSPDGKWLLFFVDPFGSASIIADGGAVVRALNVASGKVVPLARMLLYRDYMTWCGSSLVVSAGEDRIATTNKRLVVTHPPDWKLRSLWPDRTRAFGTVVCAPDGGSVAVLSQPASDDANFFHTRWQLWRVGLDGSRRLLDRPPSGAADESPRWSRDGRTLLFVRERLGIGRLMIRRHDRVAGPLANLGYSLGYYGHHDWWLSAHWTAGA
jgi:WD40 repeat protein